MERCCFTDCEAMGEHKHHVTYDPPVIKMLCREHHEQITIINGIHARKGYKTWTVYGRRTKYKKLSNKYRWWLWFQWLEGKIKPTRTKKSLEWLKDWDKFDHKPDDEFNDPYPSAPSPPPSSV